MPTMATFRVGHILLAAALGVLAACSQEQQDWRSAESANTSEGWNRFIGQHPDSELAGQARAQIAQLAEQQDWKRAEDTGTQQGYRAFLARHPTGRLAEEARIHIESYALGSAPRLETPGQEQAEAWRSSSGVRALQFAAAAPDATPESEPAATPADAVAASGHSLRAEPGEAARPAPQGEPPAAVTAAPASSAAAPTASTTATPESADYGVQLGAFDSQASADREWQRLQGRFGTELSGRSPRIVLASTTAGQLYRLQAPANGEAEARALCSSLRQQEQACVPVIPR
jgi:cell division protein FtsN